MIATAAVGSFCLSNMSLKGLLLFVLEITYQLLRFKIQKLSALLMGVRVSVVFVICISSTHIYHHQLPFKMQHRITTS